MQTANFELITPSIAEKMLQANLNNRNIRPAHVENIAREMSEGRFQTNGDAIRFDSNGVLLDGQHRLYGILYSKTSQKMLVVRGLEPETMKTIDSGVKRTNGDRINMSGIKNGNVVAAAMNVMYSLAGQTQKASLTPTQLFDIYERHPGISDSITKCHGRTVVSPSFLAAFHYIGTFTGYPDEADAFLETMVTGIPASPDDPALAVREKIISVKTKSREVPRSFLLENLSVAWEAKRTGRGLRIIKTGQKEIRIKMHGWNMKAFMG